MQETRNGEAQGLFQAETESNIEWFGENHEYIRAQQELEHYRYIALMVARELEGEGEVLDIGNGGFFNYDPGQAARVTAVDLFVKDGPGPVPNTVFKRGSILDLPFPGESFDCVLAQNLLHHVVGRSVKENHANLSRCFEEISRCLRVGGKAVIIESTVGRWFYQLERLLYRPVLAVKKGGHPVTFQYTPNQLIAAAERVGLELAEYADVPSRGMTILQFGRRWPMMLTPARPVKLVFKRS